MMLFYQAKTRPEKSDYAELILTSMHMCLGNEATLNFYLTNFTDERSLTAAVRRIPYKGGNTNTTGGLRLMRQQIFHRDNGDRPNVPNVVILITDGIPTREVGKLPGEVRRIKRLGIRILGVGVTNKVSSTTTFRLFVDNITMNIELILRHFSMILF